MVGWLIRLLGIVAFFVLWHVAIALGLVSDVLVSKPWETIVRGAGLLTEGPFLQDVWGTLGRTLIGLALSTIIGVVLGLMLGVSKLLYQASEMLIDFARSIPATALFPLAILLFGIGDAPKIAVVTYAGALLMLVQTYYGVTSASVTRLEVLRLSGATRVQTMRYLIFWEALPYVVAGLRLIASLSLVLVIVSEMFIGTQNGLGKRIMDAQSAYQIEELYATILLVGVIGYLLNRLMVAIERRLIHWR